MVIFLLLKAVRENLFDAHEARCIRDSYELGDFNSAEILCYVQLYLFL